MRAERVEASWDNDKKKWLIRIQSGEEVIRRYCDGNRDIDDQKIRAAAQKTLVDEGYDANGVQILIKR